MWVDPKVHEAVVYRSILLQFTELSSKDLEHHIEHLRKKPHKNDTVFSKTYMIFIKTSTFLFPSKKKKTTLKLDPVVTFEQVKY